MLHVRIYIHTHMYLYIRILISLQLVKKEDYSSLIMTFPFYVFKSSLFLVMHHLSWNFHQILL